MMPSRWLLAISLLVLGSVAVALDQEPTIPSTVRDDLAVALRQDVGVITFDDESLLSCCYRLSQRTGVAIEVDPALLAGNPTVVHLHLDAAELLFALDWLAELTNSRVEYLPDRVRFVPTRSSSP